MIHSRRSCKFCGRRGRRWGEYACSVGRLVVLCDGCVGALRLALSPDPGTKRAFGCDGRGDRLLNGGLSVG